MTQPKPDSPRAIEAVEADLEAAERKLDRLEREAAGLPGLIRDAAMNGGKRLIDAKRRNDELPAFVFEAQVRVMRLQIERCDVLFPEADRVRMETGQAAGEIHRQMQDLQSDYTHALNVHHSAKMYASDLRNEGAELRRRLAARIREETGASHAGPIVRSGWQAR